MMENSKSTKQQFKIISNNPCGEDLFAGRAHSNIAERISEVIENDTNCQVIGLEGEWGSGKSNLIELVKKNLVVGEDPQYFFFTYDTWGHQEDAQRRAILEELTDELFNNLKCMNKEKWKEKLSNLLANKRETKSKTIPHLSFGLIISLVLVILIPSLNIIAQSQDFKLKNRFMFAMIPFAILFFTYFGYLVKEVICVVLDKDWKKLITVFRNAGSELFSIYQNEKIIQLWRTFQILTLRLESFEYG